jgi:hypothetical protein
LLEGVAAGGDGVAEGGAVGEVAVFGLGCWEGLFSGWFLVLVEPLCG